MAAEDAHTSKCLQTTLARLFICIPLVDRNTTLSRFADEFIFQPHNTTWFTGGSAHSAGFTGFIVRWMRPRSHANNHTHPRMTQGSRSAATAPNARCTPTHAHRGSPPARGICILCSPSHAHGPHTITASLRRRVYHPSMCSSRDLCTQIDVLFACTPSKGKAGSFPTLPPHVPAACVMESNRSGVVRALMPLPVCAS